MNFIQVRSDCSVNNFEHAIHVAIDVIVREAEHSVSHFVQGQRAKIAFAVFVETVLIAIDFDNNAAAAAFEIDDESRDRRLTAEMESRLPAIRAGVPRA